MVGRTVKVKGKHVTAWKKAFGGHRTRYAKTNFPAVYFRMLGGESELVERYQHKTDPTPQQEFQRWLYKIVDKMLFDMTIGQAILWKRFYWYARARGWTVKHSHKGTRADEIKETKKNMGYRAFFFKRALGWNLGDWLYLWLKSMWRLVDYSLTEDTITVEARILHRDLYRLPTEPREYKVERIRF